MSENRVNSVLGYTLAGCAVSAVVYFVRQRSERSKNVPRKETTTSAAQDAADRIDWDTEKEIQKETAYTDVSPDTVRTVRRRRRLTFDETGQPILIVGVCGGSGSGKTTLSKAIIENFGEERVTYISHDFYYKDLGHLSQKQKEKHNFDHPDSLDTDLMVKHIAALRRGEKVDIPQYDFATYSRKKECITTVPHNVIIVEGILIFSDHDLVDLMDIKIFVETPDDIRFVRRLKRDMHERARSADSVITTYLRTVRPMHMTFVEPSKRVADILVPQGVNNVALDMIISRLKTFAEEVASGSPCPSP